MLAVQASSVICAVPLVYVSETMRAMPLERLANMPSFVLGVSRIRASATPVVDLRALLGTGSADRFARFVALKVEHRQVALAVDRVLGIRELEPAKLAALPPLLSGTSAELVEAIGELDQRLLLVLRAGRLCPEAAWQALVGLAR
jgi:purine-binding chemotaxis protein CheW